MPLKREKITDAERFNAVVEAYILGAKKEEVASRRGVTVGTLYAWKKDFASGARTIPERPLIIGNERINIYNDEDRILTFQISVIPILIGFVYILGYIFISINLFRFHVAPLYLFDAQYFAAGLIPSGIFLVVYLIVYYVWFPDRFTLELFAALGTRVATGLKNFLTRWKGWLLLGLFVLCIVSPLILLFTNKLLPEFHGLGLVSIILATLFSIYALGYWVYFLRKWTLIPGYPMQALETFSSETFWVRFKRIGIISVTVTYIFASFFFVPSAIDAIYKSWPQQLGGGKLSDVKLMLDINKLTEDLREDLLTKDLKPLLLTPSAQSKELCLVYRSQSSYIVVDKFDGKCDEQFEKLWVLSSDVVLGEISDKNNEK